MNISDEDLLKKANGWVYESQWAAREWREESWRDSEMYDGGEAQWTQKDYADALSAGIDPITINRTFPTCNLLLGGQAINRFETTAKGRTKDDTEMGQVMAEGIKFISDQSEPAGEFVVSDAFKDSIIPGIGCVNVGLNPDPRKEKLCLKYRDWKEMWWDPFSPPWWHPTTTRYVYNQKWVDLEDFQAEFPDKSKEILNAYDEISGEWREGGMAPVDDQAQMVEEKIRTLAASDWIDTHRKRIRPVELWYPVNDLAMFALYADGRCYEIRQEMDPHQAYQAIAGSQQLLRAIVKKMRVMTFFGESLLLQDEPTPYGHDQFPDVPFVGYIDRYGMPYGVPRQIRGQNEETNKRRSMALAMLQKRRVIAERDAVYPKGDADALDSLYEEANKLDGFMKLASGGLKKFEIEDLAQLSEYQIRLMEKSELEIREIAGPNAIRYDQAQQSGVAKKMDAQQSSVTTATLFDNLRRSLKMIGDQDISNIQSFWTYEKVLRVTDRLTGAERFVTVNEGISGGIEVKNNVTQGKFDCVVSETPADDTIREKNMDLLYKAIEKSPPEGVTTLLVAAFEMSDLPNKEMLLEKLKPMLGIEPEDENMTAEEKKQKVLQELQAMKEQQAMIAEIEMEGMKTQLNEAKLKNVELEAKINKLIAEIKETYVDIRKTAIESELAVDKQDLDEDVARVDALVAGIDAAVKMKGNGDESKSQTAGNA